IACIQSGLSNQEFQRLALLWSVASKMRQAFRNNKPEEALAALSKILQKNNAEDILQHLESRFPDMIARLRPLYPLSIAFNDAINYVDPFRCPSLASISSGDRALLCRAVDTCTEEEAEAFATRAVTILTVASEIASSLQNGNEREAL